MTFISINPANMTKFVKKNELNNNWYEIDASNAVVGRLASIIAKILRGKNKATFTPHMDNGDFVVVKNIEKIKNLLGKNFKIKNIIDILVTQEVLKRLHQKNFSIKNQVRH